MCCRLRLDVSQLHSRTGVPFGSSPLTGSPGVVTLNLPNLALRSNSTKESFLELIADAARIAKGSLMIKERTGSYWTNYFSSTTGIDGTTEALVLLTGESVATRQGLILKILELIKSKLQSSPSYKTSSWRRVACSTWKLRQPCRQCTSWLTRIGSCSPRLSYPSSTPTRLRYRSMLRSICTKLWSTKNPSRCPTLVLR